MVAVNDSAPRGRSLLRSQARYALPPAPSPREGPIRHCIRVHRRDRVCEATAFGLLKRLIAATVWAAMLASKRENTQLVAPTRQVSRREPFRWLTPSPCRIGPSRGDGAGGSA